MTRLRYLLALLDRRDRLVLAGVLVAGLLISAGAGYVHGAHERRAAREADCQQRLQATARARGYQVVRVPMPCEQVRGGTR